MLKYEFIRKELIVSPAARLVYRAAAVVSLALFPAIIAIQHTHSAGPFLKQLLFVSVVGAALNQIGMEFFLFRFDESHPLKQVFWFCVMIFMPIGPALYCFIVYSRSNAVRQSVARAHEGIVDAARKRDWR